MTPNPPQRPQQPKSQKQPSNPPQDSKDKIENPWQLLWLLLHRLSLPVWAILLLGIGFISLGVGGITNILVAFITANPVDKISSVVPNSMQQTIKSRFEDPPDPERTFQVEEAQIGKLSSDGSTSMIRMMREVQAELKGKGLSIVYGSDNKTPSGSEGGKKRLKARDIQMALLSEPLTEEDKSQGLESIEIGKDGIAVVVHKDNPIKNLTIAQLRQIYTCKITDWSTLGWSDSSSAQSPIGITVLNRSNDSGTQRSFKDKVLGENEEFCPDTLSKREDGSSFKTWDKDETTVVLGKMGKYGIYFASLNHVIKDDHVKILEIEGMSPTAITILDDTYSLTRDLYVAAQKKTNPEVLEFIKFIISPDGQKIINKYHVPIYRYLEK